MGSSGSKCASACSCFPPRGHEIEISFDVHWDLQLLSRRIPEYSVLGRVDVEDPDKRRKERAREKSPCLRKVERVPPKKRDV